MNIQGKRIWQHAAGDTNRDYAQICKDFDVILMGPGRYGKWPNCIPKIKSAYSPRKVADVRRFCEEMKDGDLVVLRMGTNEVHAVGQVVGDYEWHEQFGDVDGWDLQHTRRVCWLSTFDKPKTFDKYSLKFGDTTQELGSGAVLDWLAQLLVSGTVAQRSLISLPLNSDGTLSLTDLAGSIALSRSPALSREQIHTQLHELVTRAHWYSSQHEEPSEYETVCHLALPLLFLLGWSPEQLAVEWHDIDVAMFAQTPRTDGNLSIVLEAKRRGRSCLAGLGQAKGYAQYSGRSNCKRIILTDGKCYWVYTKRQGVFMPYAYLNLARLQPQHAIYRCAGAQATLLAMTPGWVDSEAPSLPTS